MELNIIERMRANIVPTGTLPVVGLHIRDRFYHKEFIDKCIDELERMPIRVACGDLPTNLEKLAFELLMDSAYIDPKHERELAERLAEYERNPIG